MPAFQLSMVTGFFDAQLPLPIRAAATKPVVVPAHVQ
jgi:hypothetical protein